MGPILQTSSKTVIGSSMNFEDSGPNLEQNGILSQPCLRLRLQDRSTISSKQASSLMAVSFVPRTERSLCKRTRRLGTKKSLLWTHAFLIRLIRSQFKQKFSLLLEQNLLIQRNWLKKRKEIRAKQGPLSTVLFPNISRTSTLSRRL